MGGKARRSPIRTETQARHPKPAAAGSRHNRTKAGPAAKWLWIFAIFVVFVSLTGGASRYDVLSLAPLRLISAMVLAAVAWRLSRADLGRVRIPLLMLMAIAATMALQLVPLPPALWSELPGRSLIHEIGGLLRMEEIWRPVTFSPGRTFNSLASLIVPLAALGLMAQLDARSMKHVPWIFVGVGCLSALLGIAQVAFEDASNLYFYAVTNHGTAVGLFANRNHNAVFLACCFLICLLRIGGLEGDRAINARIAIAAAMTLLICGIMVNSSRAGLLSLALALLVFMASQVIRRVRSSGASTSRQGLGLATAAPIALVAAATAMVGAFIWFERSPAFSRVLEQDAVADARVKILPVVLDMAAQFQPWGVGFGAFEQAYRTVEPESLLFPSYVNHAHNDWLQFIVEGGLAGAAIMLVLGILLIKRAIRLAPADRDGAPMQRDAGIAFGVLFILGVASTLDYPLRTPTMMVFGIWCLTVIFHPASAERDSFAVANK